MFKFFNMLATALTSLPSSFTWGGYFAKVFGVTTGVDYEALKNSTTALTEAQKKQLSQWNSFEAAEKAVGIVETALWIVVGVVGLAAVIYAIFLGFQLAKAADQSKRDEAKKHLITVIIAIVVTLVLVIFFLYLLPGILSAFHGVNL